MGIFDDILGTDEDGEEYEDGEDEFVLEIKKHLKIIKKEKEELHDKTKKWYPKRNIQEYHVNRDKNRKKSKRS